MRILIVLILLCFFLACKEDKDKSSNFSQEDFNEHYIHEIKGTLLLPLEYQRVTSENRIYILSKVDSVSSLAKITGLLDRDRRNYVLFVKEGNIDDYILIRNTDHTNFSKRDANQYLGIVESVIKGSEGYLNYSRLQNRMTTTERSKYIKVKYRLEYNEGRIFRTQYVVTSNISTFEVLEMRRDATDYEDLIKRINYIVN